MLSAMSYQESLAKAVRALRDEVELFNPRRLVAQTVSHALPPLTFSRVRTATLRAAGFRIGRRSLVMGSFKITGNGDHRGMFSVGEDSMITGPLHVDIGAEVRIGDRVYLGHNVALLTVDHEIGPAAR